MNINNFQKDDLISDEKYICYHPICDVKIFGYTLEKEEAHECDICISPQNELSDVLPLINKYVDWLSDCRGNLITYFEGILEENLPSNWYDEIEIISFSITVNNLDDYGATIYFGESVFSDHIIELDFEKEEIIDNRLNG